MNATNDVRNEVIMKYSIQPLIDLCKEECMLYSELDNTQPSEYMERIQSRMCVLITALNAITGESWYYSSTHGEMRVYKED